MTKSNKPLPRVLGWKKIFPPTICGPALTYVEDDVEMIVVIPLKGPHRMPSLEDDSAR